MHTFLDCVQLISGLKAAGKKSWVSLSMLGA